MNLISRGNGEFVPQIRLRICSELLTNSHSFAKSLTNVLAIGFTCDDVRFMSRIRHFKFKKPPQKVVGSLNTKVAKH